MISNINRSNIFSLFAILIIYTGLLIFFFNSPYFWDTIQQVSKEGHWFYLNNFDSLLITEQSNSDIFATGYHPPLMGIMTAFLWKIFGYNLCISHIFSLFWAFILVYNLWRLVSYFFDKKNVGICVFILLIEPTVLTQFAISSPDFVMLTAFVISIRSIIEKKSYILSISLIFLCCLNMRGVFLGVTIFISNLYFTYLQSGNKLRLKLFIKNTVPYIPTLLVLTSYYIYYFTTKGWFFNNSPYTSHYTIPENFNILINHLLSLFLRLTENGRFLIWLIFLLSLFRIFRMKIKLSTPEKFLLLNIALTLGLYFLFAFITQMPFSARYFMPIFLLVSILALNWMCKSFKINKIITPFVFIIMLQIVGNFWIYPEKMAVGWDSTLAHYPFYKLKKECFAYIDNNNISYQNVSAGFQLYGNRLYSELEDLGNISQLDLEKEFVLYSNISNLDDKYINILHDDSQWKSIKTMESWPVFITIYQKIK